MGAVGGRAMTSSGTSATSSRVVFCRFLILPRRSTMIAVRRLRKIGKRIRKKSAVEMRNKIAKDVSNNGLMNNSAQVMSYGGRLLALEMIAERRESAAPGT